jgi:hypothetical protein
MPGFIQAGEKMRGSRSRRSSANAKPSGQFRLAGGGKRRALLMANAQPLDTFFPPNCIRERV